VTATPLPTLPPAHAHPLLLSQAQQPAATALTTLHGILVREFGAVHVVLTKLTVDLLVKFVIFSGLLRRDLWVVSAVEIFLILISLLIL
jgi:hypothetical protein